MTLESVPQDSFVRCYETQENNLENLVQISIKDRAMIFKLSGNSYREVQSLTEVGDFIDLSNWVPTGFNLIEKSLTP